MPQINQGLELFANWQTIVMGVVIYVMTLGGRRIVETAWKGAGQNKWWCEIFLPLGPVLNGVLLIFLVKKTFPWPPPVADSMSAQIMYGICCGISCGWLYGRVRGFMKAEVETDEKKTPEL